MAYATGVSLATAARVAGISCSTAKAWAKESRENPNGPKGKFWPMLRGALAKSIVVSASEARRADPKWWLARMSPNRFGDPTKRVKIDHTTNGGEPSPAEMRRYAEEILHNLNLVEGRESILTEMPKP